METLTGMRSRFVGVIVALGLLFVLPVAPTVSGFAQSVDQKFSCPANARAANLSVTLKNLENKAVKLSDFKGKVLLIDFWATWCGPCKIEIPEFVDFQQRYGSSGLQVLGVSVDDTVEMLKPYVAQYKMNYPVLQGRGHENEQDAFGRLVGVPTAVLISRDSKLCARHAGLTSKEIFEREIKGLLY